MKYIRPKEIKKNFINTFNSKQKELFQGYLRAERLISKGRGIIEISKRTDNSVDRLSNWIRGKKPTSVKCFNKAKENGYFNKLPMGAQEDLAYLLGLNFGDGNIHRSLCNIWFYGNSEDLPKINKLLKRFKTSGKLHVYKINNGKLCVSNNAFARFMVSLGAPAGDKTKQRFLIPDWILLSRRKSKLKKRFLQGLFDSELSNVSLINGKRFAFQSLKFYSIKEKNFVKDGFEYLEQIRAILHEFGITTSEAKKDRLYLRSRDNGEMVQLLFWIHSNYINLCNFITEIGFLHNSKRKQSSLRVLNEIKELAKKEKDKVAKYKKAIELRRKRLSGYKIAKQLDLSISEMKNWLYRGNRPRLLNYIENRQ